MRPSTLYLHRSRFVDFTPPSITALAFSHPALPVGSPIPTSLRLAIGRSNGDIEIWNPHKGSWVHESTLKGGKDRSIEGLAWTQDTTVDGAQLRLFSIGYSSVVTEWDLELGRPRKHVDCNGGVIWSIAAQPRIIRSINGKDTQPASESEELGQSIVVGLDDGTVAMLSTEGGPGYLEYTKTLMRSSSKKARVLSLAWQNRQTVIAGMADSTLRVWDTRSGRVVSTMSLGKDTKASGGREVLAWAVKVLKNGDIVSGDSRGEVLFWDGKTYSLRQRIKAHEADVLTLEVNRTGDMVVSSGVDRRTVFFGSQKTGKHQGRWAEIFGRRYHSHDVRAMAAWEGGDKSYIISGGVDMTPILIPFQNYGKEESRVMQAVPQKPITTGISGARLLVSWYDREVKIWKIDELGDADHNDEAKPSSTEPGRKLVSRLVLEDEENITSAHITAVPNSKGAHLLAVATNAKIKLFHLRPPKSNSLFYSFRVSKVQLPKSFTILKNTRTGSDDGSDEEEDSDDDEEGIVNISELGARIIQFSPDGKWLVVVSPENKILIVGVEYIRVDAGPRSKITITLTHTVAVMDRIPRSLHHLQIQKQLSLGQAPDTPRKSKNTLNYGHLSSYPLSISRLAISSTSRILAVSDLSGHLDTYILGSSGWVSNPTGPMLPKLGAPVAAMEFRPVRPQEKPHYLSLTNGRLEEQNLGYISGEDRLMILTTHMQDVHEFDVLKGKFSEWSRRNPAKKFPTEFKIHPEMGCGIAWEVEEENFTAPSGQLETSILKERMWLWGLTWMYMFDLQQDLPEPSTKPIFDARHKRKRPGDHSVDVLPTIRHVNKSKAATDSDGDLAMQDGDNENANTSGDDDDDDDDNDVDMRWGNFSGRQNEASGEGESDGPNDAAQQKINSVGAAEPTTNGGHAAAASKQPKNGKKKKGTQGYAPPKYWSNLLYKPIMAFLPIGEWNVFSTRSGEEDASALVQVGKGSQRRGVQEGLVKEVVVVERPLWDIELPPRFFGKKERVNALKNGAWN